MTDIVIYGAGGLGREIACLISATNKCKPTWNLIGFVDDGIAPGTTNEYGRVLGNIEFLNSWSDKLAVVIAIATPKIRTQITKSINNPNVFFPNIIAPDVLFFDLNNVTMGQGNIITFGCRLSCHVSLGNFNLLNGQVSLGHDVNVADFNVFMPETRISGESTVGSGNFFGAKSLVLQGITIGNNTRIGASSVVMRNTSDGIMYHGNPAKQFHV